ncbi:hypothetical protein ACG9ZC_04155 [Acinetobacter baumannii]|uniref:hypothetical protein n=1 Tax=Acinetobacter baumannii TaxID=470 RepID=UPI003AF6A7B6
MDKKALLEQFRAEVEASGTSVNHILKMCEFNEVSNDFSSDTIHDYSVGCLNGAWWMFQRQQAKVEGLQKQLSEYIFVSETLDEMYVKEVQKSDDLQKRVDKAIRLLVEAELYQSEPNIDLAVKALKGEG